MMPLRQPNVTGTRFERNMNELRNAITSLIVQLIRKLINFLKNLKSLIDAKNSNSRILGIL